MVPGFNVYGPQKRDWVFLFKGQKGKELGRYIVLGLVFFNR